MVSLNTEGLHFEYIYTNEIQCYLADFGLLRLFQQH